MLSFKYSVFILSILLFSACNNSELEEFPEVEINTTQESSSSVGIVYIKESSSSSVFSRLPVVSKVVLDDAIVDITTINNNSGFSKTLNNIPKKQDKIVILEKSFDAIIVDATIVEGLEYSCGNKREFSKDNGLIECSSLPITFYMGNVKLGKVNKLSFDHTVFSQDILNIPRGATSHPLVNKLSHLFQLLDKDSNINNGISLSVDAATIVNTYFFNYKNFSDITDDEIAAIYAEIAMRRSNTSSEFQNIRNLSIEDIQDRLTYAITKTYTSVQLNGEK